MGIVESSIARHRRPAVAGYYYPSDRQALRSMVMDLMTTTLPRRSITAVIVPHGSYRHAGSIIGATLAQAQIPRRCILLGPSHTGSWMPWSLMMDGAYRTPLGEVPIDARCAEALRARCPFLEADVWAQHGEHAVEVLLPFLQAGGPSDLSVVPIITASIETTQRAQLATALAQVIRLQEEPVLLIASSDGSHYEPVARTRQLDQQWIARVCCLDPIGFTQALEESHAVVCGEGVMSCVLQAARQLGATQGRLIAYGTSAEAGGDPYAATGYAGMLLS